MSDLSSRLKEYAQSLGFSMLGIVPASPSPRLRAYLDWIKAGMHGEMSYLAREDRVIRRKNPGMILSSAQSIIIAALDYYTLNLPDQIAHDPGRGRFSNYAWGADYHEVMLPQLEKLVEFLQNETGEPIASRAYVDTGAVLERSHAESGGMGFTGKNTVLIHPQRGSFFFLGEILTNVALEYDHFEASSMPGCGSCSRCLTACPTNAFPRPYILDARRCISYLSIELKGMIPIQLRPLMGNWVYGCDICQDVCPWQRFAKPQWHSAFGPIDYDRAAPPLTTLLTLDDEQFKVTYNGSAVFRIKRDRLVRNACVAAGNSQLPELADHLVPLLSDRSDIVRAHAAWALGQLGTARTEMRAAARSEADPNVKNELHAALASF